MTSTIAETPKRVVIVGAGRLGRALARALSAAGVVVVGPLGRGEIAALARATDVILLCVPDSAVATVASSIAEGPLVGHCAGALTLDVLAPHSGFSLHPLLSVSDDVVPFAGAACAIAGRNAGALEAARNLATRVGMHPLDIRDADRASYHAAASMASNYLVTLEDAAGQIARRSGLERQHLARLAQSALDNWVRLGSSALTGPIVRGDEETVSKQREAVERDAPHLIPLWDAMSDATHALAATPPSLPR